MGTPHAPAFTPFGAAPVRGIVWPKREWTDTVGGVKLIGILNGWRSGLLDVMNLSGIGAQPSGCFNSGFTDDPEAA